ncbi:MAG: hypothetical protein WAV30_01405 [Microgenomates group bacterium]
MKIFRGKLKFGDNHILLEINDEDLIIFIEKEYIYHETTGNADKGISLSVQPSTSGITFTFRKDGHLKKKVNIARASGTPYKEFILQGMIEMCLSEMDIFFMHASSFVEKKNLHIFLGTSGSGKTTILKRLDPKIVTSNDTIVLMKNNKGSVDVLYPSPFDKKTYGKVREKIIALRKVHFYSLKKAKINTIGLLLLHEKMELLVQNMNAYMFSVQKDVARNPALKSELQEMAIKKAFLLLRSIIRRLSFNKRITSEQFIKIQT